MNGNQRTVQFEGLYFFPHCSSRGDAKQEEGKSCRAKRFMRHS